MCTSNGVYFDATPPNMSLATMSSHLAVTGPLPEHTADRNVQSISHMILGDVLGIFDPETDVKQYYAAVGRGSLPESILPFQYVGSGGGEVLLGGLVLPEGKVNLTIRALNGALERSDKHIGIGIDTTAPQCSNISINYHRRGQKFQYTDNVDRMVAEWNCSDVSWQGLKALRSLLAFLLALSLFPHKASVRSVVRKGCALVTRAALL